MRRRSGPAAARPEALYGYEAARLVLDAVAEGRQPARRPWCGRRCGRGRGARPWGRYEINRSGDVTGPPLALYRLENGVFRPLVERG